MKQWKQHIVHDERGVKNVAQRRVFNEMLQAGSANKLNIKVVESRKETGRGITFPQIKAAIQLNLDRYHFHHIYKKTGDNEATYNEAYRKLAEGTLSKHAFEKIVKPFRLTNKRHDHHVTGSNEYFIGGNLDGKEANLDFDGSTDQQMTVKIGKQTLRMPYQCRMRKSTSTRRTRSSTKSKTVYTSVIGAGYNIKELNRATTIAYATTGKTGNKMLVGYAFGRYENQRKKFYLSILCSSHRAGARLLRFMERYLRKLGVETLYLRAAHNNGYSFDQNFLVKWYKRMGYIARPEPCKGDRGFQYAQHTEQTRLHKVYRSTEYLEMERQQDSGEITEEEFENRLKEIRLKASHKPGTVPYKGALINEEGWLMSKCLKDTACTTVRGESGRVQVYSRCKDKLVNGRCKTKRYEEPRCVPDSGWGKARTEKKRKIKGKYSKLSNKAVNVRRQKDYTE